MSEYQYYEFRALDRPLTTDEMRELRALSTRAEITPRSFQNTYNYGDFRGDPSELMKRYFDAHVYASNFGSMVFMARLPRAVLSETEVAPYEAGEGVGAWSTDQHTIVEWRLGDEPSGEWVDGEEWMDRLLPIRDELARGDHRSLYIGWLSAVAHGVVDEDWDEEEPEDEDDADDEDAGDEEKAIADESTASTLEPPVPPGLGSLSGAQEALAEFLEVDEDLIAAAAGSSPSLELEAASPEGLAEWVAGLPVEDTRAALVRVIRGDGLRVQMELQSLYHRSAEPRAGGSDAAPERRRTASELLSAAEKLGGEREHREAEERERTRREHMASILERLPALWSTVYESAEQQSSSAYDRVVEVLVDMRDACDYAGRGAEFDEEFARFLSQHGRRTALRRRLRLAQLIDSGSAAA